MFHFLFRIIDTHTQNFYLTGPFIDLFYLFFFLGILLSTEWCCLWMVESPIDLCNLTGPAFSIEACCMRFMASTILTESNWSRFLVGIIVEALAFSWMAFNGPVTLWLNCLLLTLELFLRFDYFCELADSCLFNYVLEYFLHIDSPIAL